MHRALAEKSPRGPFPDTVHLSHDSPLGLQVGRPVFLEMVNHQLCVYRVLYISLSCFRPVDLGTSRRITPSDLESHRRTHYFQAPSCLCAFLDSKPYSESRIAVVHLPIKLTKLSSLSGEYTAECAMGRCGYIGKSPIIASSYASAKLRE